MTANKPHSNKEAAVQRVSRLENLITKLEIDHKSAQSYRNDEVVADCLDKAKRSQQAAMDALLANDLKATWHSSTVAWLYFSLGRKILDGNTIEHLLGESTYLELSGVHRDQLNEVERDFAALEKLILRLRGAAMESKKAR
ncbi:MAG TPA: hypothetical protein V6C81_01460 [Planktothrix sp.]